MRTRKIQLVTYLVTPLKMLLRKWLKVTPTLLRNGLKMRPSVVKKCLKMKPFLLRE